MDKVVLVTGASSGIGKECVRSFLRRGYTVYGAARRFELMKDLEELGANILEMDVTNEESVKKSIEIIQNKHGAVDILINNAGYGLYGSVEEVTLEEAKKQFEVNIFSIARLVQLVVPAMREKGFGKIVNIGSVGGKVYSYFGGWYYATKHALEGLNDCLRLELKDFNIDVILMQPGLIKTEIGQIINSGLYKASGNGPYKSLVKRVIKKIDFMYKNSGSHPVVVADKVVKACEVKNPKTRYYMGKYAFLMLSLRKILTDKQFDYLSYSMI